MRWPGEGKSLLLLLVARPYKSKEWAWLGWAWGEERKNCGGKGKRGRGGEMLRCLSAD